MSRRINNDLPFDVILKVYGNTGYFDQFLPTQINDQVVIPAKSQIIYKGIPSGSLFSVTMKIGEKEVELDGLRRAVDNQPISIGVKYTMAYDGTVSSMSDLVGVYLSNNLPFEVRILHQRPGLKPVPRAVLRAKDGMGMMGASNSRMYYTGLPVEIDPFGTGGINIGDKLIFDLAGNGVLEFTVRDPYIKDLIIGEVSTSCEGRSNRISLYRLGGPNYNTWMQYYDRVPGTYANLPQN